MKLTVTLHPARVTSFLLKIVLTLLVCGCISSFVRTILRYNTVLGFVPLFDLNGEANIPSVYSALAIWFSASLLWYIFMRKKREGNKQAICWRGLSFVFIFLGMDELTQIHEKLKTGQQFLSKFINLPESYLYWTVFYGVALLVFSIWIFRFYWQLPRATRIRFTIAGITYIAGALGMEIVGGYYERFVLGSPYDTSVGLPALGMGGLILVEEGLEMIGIVLFIRAILLYMREYISPVNITIQSTETSATNGTALTHETSLTTVE